MDHVVKVHCYFKKSSILPGKERTSWIYSCDAQGGVCRSCKFRVPGRGSLGHVHISSNALFLWNLLLFSQAWRGLSECTGMMIKEGFVGVVDFVTPGAGVLCLGVTE